jgi:hypothetical protein
MFRPVLKLALEAELIARRISVRDLTSNPNGYDIEEI